KPLKLSLGEVIVLLRDRYALSHETHESIVRIVVNEGDAAPREHLEVVADELAQQYGISVCFGRHAGETLAFDDDAGPGVNRRKLDVLTTVEQTVIPVGVPGDRQGCPPTILRQRGVVVVPADGEH